MMMCELNTPIISRLFKLHQLLTLRLWRITEKNWTNLWQERGKWWKLFSNMILITFLLGVTFTNKNEFCKWSFASRQVQTLPSRSTWCETLQMSWKNNFISHVFKKYWHILVFWFYVLGLFIYIIVKLKNNKTDNVLHK